MRYGLMVLSTRPGFVALAMFVTAVTGSLTAHAQSSQATGTRPGQHQPSTGSRRNRPPTVNTNGIRPPTRAGDPERLDLSGLAGAYFYRPARGGRQRVLVYLHSRGADPRESCRKWHESTPRFGWLVCPIGPHEHERGAGHRQWRNDAGYARRESIASIERLVQIYPRRVQRHDNVIMGFSEGAYVAMNAGLQEPETFPRWLICAANDGYIDGERQRIQRLAGLRPRIYLITGLRDEIIENSRRAEAMLIRAFGRRRVKFRVMDHASHELPPEFVPVTRRALLWVTQ